MSENLNENNIDNSSEITPDNKNIPGPTDAKAADAGVINDVVDEIPEKPFSLKKEVFEWFYTIAIALVVAFIIKGFFFDFVNVSGDSMFPTLYNGDMLIVRKIGYTPKQGDVIILDSNYERREEYYDSLEKADGKEYSSVKKFFHTLTLKDKNLKKTYYVKRIIALPGQTVDFKDGKVYVDGKQLDESYLKMDLEITDEKIKANGRKLDNSSLESANVSVSDDDVYVYGKPLDESHYDILPQTLNSEYPVTVEEGHVFVLGDNRSHSKDSRSPDLGQVPYEAIMGKAVFRLFPFNGFGTI